MRWGRRHRQGDTVLQKFSDQTGPARGAVFIHACPAALCPHIEWAI
ncbi:MAG: DUF3145 domain-containing protein, partial [Actinomycetota bacterium]|nr:DUF3145 domain-containing protein [Actinomycetota bacterium]